MVRLSTGGAKTTEQETNVDDTKELLVPSAENVQPSEVQKLMYNIAEKTEKDIFPYPVCRSQIIVNHKLWTVYPRYLYYQEYIIEREESVALRICAVCHPWQRFTTFRWC